MQRLHRPGRTAGQLPGFELWGWAATTNQSRVTVDTTTHDSGPDVVINSVRNPYSAASHQTPRRCITTVAIASPSISDCAPAARCRGASIGPPVTSQPSRSAARMYRPGMARYLMLTGSRARSDHRGAAFKTNRSPRGGRDRSETESTLAARSGKSAYHRRCHWRLSSGAGVSCLRELSHSRLFRSAWPTPRGQRPHCSVERQLVGTATARPAVQLDRSRRPAAPTSSTYPQHSRNRPRFELCKRGWKHPSASNKTTITHPQTSVQLAADKNGKITGSAILDTGAVSMGGFSCPSGQTLVALSATFTNNMITDTTNGVTATDGDISVILGP